MQACRHRLVDRDSHEAPEPLLEAEALVARRAGLEVFVRLLDLLVREHAVHVRLHHRFAVLTITAHQAVTGLSARFCFRTRRPRWSRDITVPTGMSRICAASA